MLERRGEESYLLDVLVRLESRAVPCSCCCDCYDGECEDYGSGVYRGH